MAAEQSNPDFAFLPESTQAEARAMRPIKAKLARAYVTGFAKPERDHAAERLPPHPHDVRIVAVQDRRSRRGQHANHPGLLGPRHIQRAERALMLAPDRCHDGHVRTDRTGIALHLAETGNSDFERGTLLARADAQHGVGHRAPCVTEHSRAYRQPERSAD